MFMDTDKEFFDPRYREFKELTDRIAAEVGLPLFYSEEKDAVERSRRIFSSHPAAEELLAYLGNNEEYPGHGLYHVKKVALDAGALILIDGADAVGVDRVDRLVFLSHLAGLLHDIRRSEPNHARRSAEEAGRILKTFDIETLERDFIIQAIANHEAFQPVQPLDDPSAQMLSNALYDADKFRWGPDNFTETLWAIIMSRRLKLEDLAENFPGGLAATERIRGTFRTRTGKKYGPDFIDRALEIGNRLFAFLSSHA